MNDLAWVLFAITCVALSGRLLYTVARAKLAPRQEWIVGEDEAGEFEACPPTVRTGELTPSQMKARCLYAEPWPSGEGRTCYLKCAPNCALYTPGDGHRPLEATALIRRPKLHCLGG